MQTEQKVAVSQRALERTEHPLKIFSGNSNVGLAQSICDYLELPLGRALVSKFANGETRIRLEENVRGCDVFVLQSMCEPVDHNLVELLLMIDALRRASSFRITAVIPYYGYAKQEKKTAGREPISAKLVANIIATAGAHRVLTIDLHSPAIEGFFDIPVDHLRAAPLLATYFKENVDLHNVVVVSPDAGGVRRADDFRSRIGTGSLAIISKQRPEPDRAEILEMVGEVEGKRAIIVDDMISTGGTLIEATEYLLKRGASEVYACATHPVFAGQAVELIRRSPLKQVVVTDTIPVPVEARDHKIVLVSVAPLFAEAIARIHTDRSVSELFT